MKAWKAIRGLLGGIVLMSAIGISATLVVPSGLAIWFVVGPLDALLVVGLGMAWRDRRWST